MFHWKIVRILFCVMLIVFSASAFSQIKDSIVSHVDEDGDTLFMITENRLGKNKFWGNSWMITPEFGVSEPTKIDGKTDLEYRWGIGFGRTFGKIFTGGGGTYLTMTSWGVGYSYLAKKQSQHYGSLFYERSAFPIPPGTLRLEYITNLQTQERYLKPAIGFSLYVLDIMYSYSIGLQRENNFSHGFTLRIKLYPKSDKWQVSYPSRC